MTRGHDSGRHRRGASPLAWTPLTRGGRARAAHAAAEADTDIIPVVDDYPDAPAAGLAKFNLGSIPASVTPPPSWRRAAWFSVAASALVLVGLVFAASSLVTGPRKPDVVDALPGLPTAPNMLTVPTEETTREPLPTEVPTTTTATPTTTRDRTSAQPPPPREPTQAPRPTTTTTQDGTRPTPPPARPTRTTVSTPMLVPAPTDPQAMGDRTEEYYRQVVEDPDAAYAMTTGPLHREGPDSIERRYPDVKRVEVESITIDANRGTTRSRLRVVRADGSATTMERELTFTYGSDPKITADSAAS